MGLLILLVVLAVPVAEIWILWTLAHHIGLLATLAVLVGSGIAGGWIARHVGARSLRRIQESMAAGEMPGDGVLGGALVLVGSLLLIVPGLLTDAIGLLLLFPPTRALIALPLRHVISRKLRDGSMRVTGFGPPPQQPPDGIDPDRIIDIDPVDPKE